MILKSWNQGKSITYFGNKKTAQVELFQLLQFVTSLFQWNHCLSDIYKLGVENVALHNSYWSKFFLQNWHSCNMSCFQIWCHCRRGINTSSICIELRESNDPKINVGYFYLLFKYFSLFFAFSMNVYPKETLLFNHLLLKSTFKLR